jgi:hypothetical protein
MWLRASVTRGTRPGLCETVCGEGIHLQWYREQPGVGAGMMRLHVRQSVYWALTRPESLFAFDSIQVN